MKIAKSRAKSFSGLLQKGASKSFATAMAWNLRSTSLGASFIEATARWFATSCNKAVPSRVAGNFAAATQRFVTSLVGVNRWNRPPRACRKSWFSKFGWGGTWRAHFASSTPPPNLSSNSSRTVAARSWEISVIAASGKVCLARCKKKVDCV